mmetsp:Transcript_8560/g.19477  ORF Transcript_8560/g.19477 Transcript_8560/m.19477 type:complete len:230 (-) Transcript_8560:615-1304(-)
MGRQEDLPQRQQREGQAEGGLHVDRAVPRNGQGHRSEGLLRDPPRAPGHGDLVHGNAHRAEGRWPLQGSRPDPRRQRRHQRGELPSREKGQHPGVCGHEEGHLRPTAQPRAPGTTPGSPACRGPCRRGGTHHALLCQADSATKQGCQGRGKAGEATDTVQGLQGPPARRDGCGPLGPHPLLVRRGAERQAGGHEVEEVLDHPGGPFRRAHHRAGEKVQAEQDTDPHCRW